MSNPASSKIRRAEESALYKRMNFKQRKQFHREEIEYHMAKYWQLDEQERQSLSEAVDAREHAREVENL